MAVSQHPIPEGPRPPSVSHTAVTVTFRKTAPQAPPAAAADPSAHRVPLSQATGGLLGLKQQGKRSISRSGNSFCYGRLSAYLGTRGAAGRRRGGTGGGLQREASLPGGSKVRRCIRFSSFTDLFPNVRPIWGHAFWMQFL